MHKAFLEINGVRYEHTHFIEDLLDDVMDRDIRMNIPDGLYDFAPAISKWESKSRCIKNYLFSKRQIDKGMQLVS